MTEEYEETSLFVEELGQKLHQSLIDYWNGETLYHPYQDDVPPKATFKKNKKLLKAAQFNPMIKEFFILGDQETEYRSLVKVKTRTPEDKAAIFLASYYKEYPAAIDSRVDEQLGPS